MLAQSKFIRITLDFFTPLIIALVASISLYLLFFSPIFMISQITCFESFKPCQNENVIVELEKYKGQNLFLTTTNSLEKRLMSGDFMIKQVDVRKEMPSHIIVSTFSINPEAAISVLAKPDVWILTDREGKVIKETNDKPNTPIVYINELSIVRIGKPLPEDYLRQAIALMISIRDSSIDSTKYYLVDAETLVVTLSTGHKTLFALDKEATIQIKALQAILSDSTMKKDTYQTIDLRFAQPVLRQN